MSGFAEPKRDETIAVEDGNREKSMGQHSEILVDKEIMTDAQNAETREHEMTLWEAVKDHPMACFWAFVFCFTIVSAGATQVYYIETLLTLPGDGVVRYVLER